MTLTKILTFTLLSLLVLVLALAGCFTAVAEYSDIDSNAVVTFNQQVKNGNFATSDGWQSYNSSSFTISNFEVSINAKQFGGISQSGLRFYTHKYYLSVDSYGSSDSDTLTINISRNPEVTFDLTTSYQTYDTVLNITYFWGSYGEALYIVTTIDSVVYLRNFYIIDLTLMYGAGNEPTLDQCRNIFTSEYYGYTSNMTMPLNGVNSYSQGYNAAVSQFNYIVDFSQISQYGYGLEFNGWRPAFKYDYDTPDSFSFSGYVSLPLGQTVPRDTLMTGSFKAVDVDSDFTLSLGLIYNNQFVPIVNFGQLNDDPDNPTTYTFSFSLPYDTNNIVLFASASAGPSVQDYYGVFVEDFVLSYRYFNPLFSSSDAYNDGFVNGVNSGKVDGYNRGYAAGIKYGSSAAKEGTFLNLLSSVIQAPITALVGQYDAAAGERVGGLLNFEFLGYNMSTFLMSLFSLGLVICVIRLFI